MDCASELKFKSVTDNIIETEHNNFDRSLKLHYKCEPDTRCISSIIRYLNSTTDWKNFKFNQYSVKKNDNNYVIIFNYVAPKLAFQK